MSLQCFILLLTVCWHWHGTTAQTTTEHIEATTFLNENFTTDSINGTEERNLTSIPCSDGQLQCKTDGRCIPNNTLCDGFIDCRDASDEYRIMCNKLPNNTRPLFGLFLHCSSFWSDYHNDLCPQICQNSPEYCYYAFLAANNEEDQALCMLPEFPVHGYYNITPYKNSDPEAPKDFWLDYDCEPPYVIIQKSRHECINSEWFNNDDNRYCSEACKLNKNNNFTYACPEDLNNKTDCKDYVAINTNITVKRSLTTEGEKTNVNLKNVTVEILCSSDKEFQISTDCVDAVDKRQQEFENPTMTEMTTYETEFNKFRTNETSRDFEKLVAKFHEFEAKVRQELKDMHEMAEKCDISLDLLLWHLQSKKDAENAKRENEGSLGNDL